MARTVIDPKGTDLFPKQLEHEACVQLLWRDNNFGADRNRPFEIVGPSKIVAGLD
jgi:hypothetical protein